MASRVLLSRWRQGVKAAMPLMLDVNGTILLSIGAGLIYTPAGWITAGLASFAINWRIHGD